MLSPDILLERLKLKRAVSLWRTLFFVILALCIIFSGINNLTKKQSQYIARVTISGDISQNSYDTKKLQLLANSQNVNAVILNINSPGGTAFAGEDLYHRIKQIAQKKPTVAVIQTIATSAAYMIILPAEHIVARNNSLTGSIGAVVFAPNASELLNKIGVKVDTIRKGDLKASPLPFEQPNNATKKMLSSIIDDNYDTFLDAVKKHRTIPPHLVKTIADSRIFTGRQAKASGLIDAIGGEEEAIEWLKKKHKITSHVRDFQLKAQAHPLKNLLDKQVFSSIKLWVYNNVGSYMTMYK